MRNWSIAEAGHMRWLADECVSAVLVSRLRDAGHDVLYIAEFLSGATDPAVLELANAQSRVLLTEDKDFGDLVFRSRRVVPGVMLLRLDAETGDEKWQRLQTAITELGDRIGGRYIVVDAKRIRSRPLLRSA
jgi:predicted nuclease of predicted toxin-antitoxin system